MAECVYRVTEIVGVSSESWEACGAGCRRDRREERPRVACG